MKLEKGLNKLSVENPRKGFEAGKDIGFILKSMISRTSRP